MAQWKAELFGCTEDTNTCLLGFFAPCWLFGTVAEQIDGSDKIAMCFGYAFLGNCCACIIHSPKRERLRLAYSLEEKPSDNFATCCCCCCAVIQEAREITLRGVPPGGRIPLIIQPRQR